jgi:hypothetical protein
MRKPRGSLSKRPGRSGTRGSRPLDLDLTAWTRSDLDLILRVDFGSDGSDLILRAGRRRLTPATNSAAALVGNSPDFTETGAPGVKSTRVWIWDDQRAMRHPPGPKTRYDRALGGMSDGNGGSVRQSSPARVCSRVSGLGSRRDQVSECVRCKSKPERGLRGVLMRSSALATAERRYMRQRRTGVRCSST